MKKVLGILSLLVAVLLPMVAVASDVKMTAVIQKINLKGNQASVSIKDTKTEKIIEVTVVDELTLDKFKDHRIDEGDEVRVKFDSEKKTSLFRKTAGC